MFFFLFSLHYLSFSLLFSSSRIYFFFFNWRLSLNILCVVFECMLLVTATIRTSVSPLYLQTNIFTPTSICTEARFNRRHETLNDAHTTHSIHSKRTERSIQRAIHTDSVSAQFYTVALSLFLSIFFSPTLCLSLFHSPSRYRRLSL